MTPTLVNKLALLATMLEEIVENQRLNSPSDINEEAQFALDDAEVQTFLVQKRQLGDIRYKRHARRPSIALR